MSLDKQRPILYSFRRCPYAIRARLAIAISHVTIELREVLLKNKPAEMLAVSPKGTVPILVLNNERVIDESLDIMHWALQQSDPDNWLLDNNKTTIDLIHTNDNEFKIHLDHYKYADRFPQHSMTFYRQQTEVFLLRLEKQLEINSHLVSAHFSLADAAIFPFIRQLAFVDKTWFDQCQYKCLQKWLDNILYSELFNSVMNKNAIYNE